MLPRKEITDIELLLFPFTLSWFGSFDENENLLLILQCKKAPDPWIEGFRIIYLSGLRGTAKDY